MISALLFTSVLLPAQAFAEGITTSIGFGAGPTYGAGISIRGESNNWGLQATTMPFYTKDTTFFAAGLTGFYVINKGKHEKFYVSLGTGAFYKTTKIYNSAFTQTSCDNVILKSNVCGYWKNDIEGTPQKSGGVAIGPGIGLEFDFAENFTFSIELPTAIVFDVSDKISFKSIVPIPNGALLYRF